MQLIKAHVTNYRSVEDSDVFDIEPDVTCLVGKNESGKTATLKALYRLNPVEKTARFDEVIDYPARKTRDRKRIDRTTMIPVITVTFRMGDAEVAELEEQVGKGALLSPEFTLSRGYRSDADCWSVAYEEKAMLDHFLTGLDLNAEASAALGAATSVTGLIEAIESLSEPTVATTARLAEINQKGTSGLDCIVQWLQPRLPKFVYFDDYDSMPGKVSIPDLIRRRDKDALTRGERALLSLLNMAGADLEEFKDVAEHERLIRELENASTAISDEVFEYWSQSTELAVKLESLPAEVSAVAPLNEAPILQIRVRNDRHRASVPFDERSRGFVWFFSFLAYFTELEDEADQQLVLLLDEPGLSLHGRAQEDLLRLIDERLAPKHQVIYTTHSPFLVSADAFHRVRTVIDRDGEGTKVSAEVFKADQDTAFPLLNAMGVELSQTLFVGEHTLLLEGPSDLIYLDVLTDVLEAKGREGLDSRWVKTPIGGAGKLSTFVTLLGANKLNVAVLVDSSTQDAGAVKRLQGNGQLAGNGLVQVSEFTGTADADIEDLFDRDFYLGLVNAAYEQELPAPIAFTDINQNDPRIVRAIEAYFRENKIAGGKFNHYRPAVVLLRKQASLASKIKKDALDRAEKLVVRLNQLLP